jgi:hypothetical protein
MGRAMSQRRGSGGAARRARSHAECEECGCAGGEKEIGLVDVEHPVAEERPRVGLREDGAVEIAERMRHECGPEFGDGAREILPPRELGGGGGGGVAGERGGEAVARDGVGDPRREHGGEDRGGEGDGAAEGGFAPERAGGEQPRETEGEEPDAGGVVREDGETENCEADDDAVARVAVGEEQVETGEGEEDGDEFRPRVGGVLEEHRVEQQQAGDECGGGATAAEGAREEHRRKKGERAEEQHEHLVMRETGAGDPEEGGIGEVGERRTAGEDDEAAERGVVLALAQEEERALILLLPVAHPHAAIVARDAREEDDAGQAEERPCERGLADGGIAGEFDNGATARDRRPEAQRARNAVAPADLLPLGVGAAVVGDAHLVDAALRSFADLGGDLGLEAEAVLLDGDLLRAPRGGRPCSRSPCP